LLLIASVDRIDIPGSTGDEWTDKRINHFINSPEWGIIVNSCREMLFLTKQVWQSRHGLSLKWIPSSAVNRGSNGVEVINLSSIITLIVKYTGNKTLGVVLQALGLLLGLYAKPVYAY